MTRTVFGTVHGRTTELDEDLGVAQGQQDEVQVRMISGAKKLPGPPPRWQPGSTKTIAGALADLDTAEKDRLLEEIYQDRKCERRAGAPE